jgi:diguanylate cyclase (GGDEF)-like protein
MELSEIFLMQKQGLRRKLVISFSLMSIVPLLIILYFTVNYVFVEPANLLQGSIIILLTLWIAILGFIIIRRMVMPVINLAEETQEVAKGNYETPITIKRDDELGIIAEVVDMLRERMIGYVDELKRYGRTTTVLNSQIRDKVSTLANIIQTGELVTTGSGFDEVLGFVAEKLTDELEGSYVGIFVKEDKGNYATRSFVNKSGKNVPSHEILKKLSLLEKSFLEDEKFAYMDSRPLLKHWQIELREEMNLVNALFYPMKSGESIVGMIMLGNFAPGHEFNADYVQVIKAFEKILIVGYQASKIFAEKTTDVLDVVTGLLSRDSFESKLKDEIKRAAFYQRACSLILLGIDDFSAYSKKQGKTKAEELLMRVAKLVPGLLSPVVKVARFGDSEFGVILPETNKREAIKVAENIRAHVAEMQLSTDASDRVTVSAGVGENPIDGVDASSIIAKATDNLTKAIGQGKNMVLGE